MDLPDGVFFFCSISAITTARDGRGRTSRPDAGSKGLREPCAARTRIRSFSRQCVRWFILAAWGAMAVSTASLQAADGSDQPGGPALFLPLFDAPTAEETPEDPLGEEPTDPEPADPAGEGQTEPLPGDVAEPAAEDDRQAQPDPSEPEPQPEPTEDAPASTSEEPAPARSTPSVGEPLAAGIVRLMQDEIAAGFRQRGIDSQFRRFTAYAAQRLDATAGRNTGSEINGVARLKWLDHMLRNPLEAPAEAERFTRELQKAVINEHGGLGEMLAIARSKMDLPARAPRTLPAIDSPEAALDLLRQCLIDAQAHYAAAFRPLSKREMHELATGLYPVFAEHSRAGHTLPDRARGRRLCDLIESVDRGALYAAAEDLVLLADPRVLDQLAAIPDRQGAPIRMRGTTGSIAKLIETPAGTIVVGGRSDNTYHLDEMPGVAAVVDLGGNNTYYEGTVSVRRPVLVIIDLDGDDKYIGKKPGIQGSAVMGISVLIDRAGNDTYQAVDVAQGSALCGVGILIDFGGNDTFHGLRRVQGTALGGLGVLVNRDGDDRYRAAMWSQGLGHPFGFGLLADLDGDDHYYTGGLYPDSYPETPGYEGWGQGVGAGIRQVANGGIGVILDGGGDDVYEYDYLSHGGGYWLGLGFARDFAGNDRRVGGTKTAYNGGPRTERDFVRFGCGWGCHYALGFLFDDAGDDLYTGTIMSTGFAWDLAVGYLIDFGGNDVYIGNQGNGAQAGLGVLFDYDGDDEYRGNRQGFASPSMTYHSLPEAGGNFSFLIDYGGNDKYGSGARNNSYLQRGSPGGFIIDRPRRDEVPSQTAEKSAKPRAAGS